MTGGKKLNLRKLKRKSAMTLMEALIVVSLMSMMGLALYRALHNGIAVWERSQQYVMEEDVMIFFDKISADVHNSVLFSLLKFDGSEIRFSFPTIVRVPADPESGYSEDEYIEQIGRVEYYFDLADRSLKKRVANYSQSLKENFQTPQVLLESVDDVTFRYVYLTEEGESVGSNIREVIPTGVEVEIRFSDNLGPRVMTKIIDIPIGA